MHCDGTIWAQGPGLLADCSISAMTNYYSNDVRVVLFPLHARLHCTALLTPCTKHRTDGQGTTSSSACTPPTLYLGCGSYHSNARPQCLFSRRVCRFRSWYGLVIHTFQSGQHLSSHSRLLCESTQTHLIRFFSRSTRYAGTTSSSFRVVRGL